jgi:hypothetical protein
MNLESIVAHMRVLWRTERIIADIRLRHFAANLGLRIFAALFAAFGLLLFELAAYFALVQLWSAITSAIALGAFNFALAAILLILALKRPMPSELALATEVQASAIEALRIEARSLQTSALGVFHRPLENALASLLPRLIPVLIRSIKRSKAAPKTDLEPDSGHSTATVEH